MADDANDVDKNFNKFVESMYQYLPKLIKDFALIKPQLLDIFKTHRPIKVGDYEYGISKSLKGKSQLIIHEFNQRSMVREYFKIGNQVWNCCECNRIGASKNDNGIPDVLVLHGIIFVKLEHECAGREISFVQKVQKLYKEKKVGEADALQKSVLGSEDLTTGKHGTKSSSKSAKELDAEIAAAIRLQYVQRQQIDDHENISFTADESHEKLSPEDAFAKIIVNLKEYTKETKEVVMANKTKLLTILKTHRPIRGSALQYGISENLRENRRLIVFEWNDRERVREYRHRVTRPNLWRCRECVRLYTHKSKLTDLCNFLYLVYGIAFVPYKHECKPKDYKLVMICQKFLEDGDLRKARRMKQKVNFAYGESSFANIVNVLENGPQPVHCDTTLKETNDNRSNCKTLTNLKRKMSSDSICLDEKSPAHKKSKLNDSTLKDTVVDENDFVLFDEKLPPVFNKSKKKANKHHHDTKVVSSIHQKSEPSTSITTTSIYHFEKPSTSKLVEICGKLNIRYRNKVVKLWDKIIFDQIDTVSMPSSNMKTHYFETENFFQILSIFFTGKSKQHERIKTTIIDAFREKLVSSGELSIKKFNKRYLDTVTDEHFAFHRPIFEKK